MSHFWHSMLFIPEPSNTTIVGPGWSLNFEMFFYATFGVTTLLLGVSSIWVAITFLLLNAIGHITGNYVAQLYSDPIVWNFVGGIAVFHLHKIAIVQREATSIFWVGVTLLLSSIFWHMADESKGLRQFLPWGVPSMLIVLGATSLEIAGKWYRLFRIRPLLILGEASYSIYLIHSVCFFGIANVIWYQWKLQQVITPDGSILVYLVVCCLIGILVHKIVEKPAIYTARQFFPFVIRLIEARKKRAMT